MLTQSDKNLQHVAVITAEEYDVAAGMLIAREAGAMVEAYDFKREGKDFTAIVAGHNRDAFDVVKNKISHALKRYKSVPLSGPKIS